MAEEFGGGFASGFAQGFIRSREKSEDRRAEQENIMFKYKMDGLMQQKEKRTKRKEQEDEWGRQAKGLSAQMGDSEFSTVALNELKNGVSYETIQKRIAEGAYATNADYKTPTQTVKVPKAVAQPVNTEPSAAAPGTLSSDEMSMAPQTPGPFAGVPVVGGIMERGRQKRAARQDERVNARIDEIDPSLRQAAEEDSGYSYTTDSANSKYQYKPKNELKIGDYADAVYKLNIAQQNKDPIALRDAQAEVRAHEMVLTRKAKIEAEAKGENVRTYVAVGPDGKLGKQFAGVARENGLYDISDPRQPNGAEVMGNFVEMNDEDMKRWNTLTDNFGKTSSDYNNIAAPAFIAAVDSAAKIDDLLTRDPGAATSTYKGIALLGRLEGEAKAAYGALTSMEDEIAVKAASGDMEGMEALIAKHADATMKFMDDSVLTPGNQQKIINGGLYNSLKLSAAYQFAMAKSSGEKMSNQDFNNEISRITGDGTENPEVVKAALRASGQEAFLRLNTVQNSLNKDPSINQFETRLGVKTGLKADRIGDKIMQMEGNDQQKAMMMQYIKTFGQDAAVAKMQANESLAKSQGVMEDPNAPAMVAVPEVGTSMDGYRFKGGNPADPNSWEKE